MCVAGGLASLWYTKCWWEVESEVFGVFFETPADGSEYNRNILVISNM